MKFIISYLDCLYIYIYIYIYLLYYTCWLTKYLDDFKYYFQNNLVVREYCYTIERIEHYLKSTKNVLLIEKSIFLKLINKFWSPSFYFFFNE